MTVTIDGPGAGEQLRPDDARVASRAVHHPRPGGRRAEFNAADGSGNRLRRRGQIHPRVSTGGGEKVTATYRVYADEFSLRTRGLDDDHAFVDGSALFLYAEKYRALPVRLEVPRTKTGASRPDSRGRGTVSPRPTTIPLSTVRLKSGRRRPHVHRQGVPRPERLRRGDVQRRSDRRRHLEDRQRDDRFLGDVRMKNTLPPPLRTVGRRWHRAYQFDHHGNRAGKPPAGEGYDGSGLSRTSSSTPNVKRLRPKGIVPYDYARENYTRGFWIAEGRRRITTISSSSGRDQHARPLPEIARRQHPRGVDASRNALQSLSQSSFDAG